MTNSLQSWTFTHLYYPQVDDTEGGIEYYIISAMSLPNNMGSLRKQFRFTVFYTTAVVFSFVNSTVYWFVTRQQDQPGFTDPSPPQESGAPGELPIIWGRDTDPSMPLYVPDMPCKWWYWQSWKKT